MYHSQSPDGSQYDLNHDYRPMRPPSPAYGPWLLFFVTLGAAGYGAHWGWKERQRLIAEVEKGKASERARQDLDTRVKALQVEKTGLVSAKDSLEKSVAAKSGELAELKGTYEKLQDKMKEEIAKGDIAVTQAGGRLRVDLAEHILFDSGEARLNKGGSGVLSRVGGILATLSDKEIQVSGHTDNKPISKKLRARYATNWELSTTRATNVVRFLQEEAKVPPERLVASGYGEYHPAGSNDTPEGRAHNRRIEILLTAASAPRAISQDRLSPAPAAAPEKKPAPPTTASAAAPNAPPAPSKK